MQALGWTDGRNLRIDVHFAAGDLERVRKNAAELAGLTPELEAPELQEPAVVWPYPGSLSLIRPITD